MAAFLIALIPFVLIGIGVAYGEREDRKRREKMLSKKAKAMTKMKMEWAKAASQLP